MRFLIVCGTIAALIFVVVSIHGQVPTYPQTNIEQVFEKIGHLQVQVDSLQAYIQTLSARILELDKENKQLRDELSKARDSQK